jgi:predicted nucleic acid-binding protein
VGAQVLLAELRYSADACGDAALGVLTFNAITADDGIATGTAAWFRDLESDGTTVIGDGSVGTSDADLILSSVAVVTGVPVSVTSKTHTVPKNV